MFQGCQGHGAVAAQNESTLSAWQRVLNGLRITVGSNDVFDRDPPQAFGQGGNALGYPGFTYDATGRFVYVRVMKKF